MRVLVLGGAGFIGSNFVRHLVSQGYTVAVYDALTYAGRLENIADLVEEGRVVFQRGDLCDEKLLEDFVRRFEPELLVNFVAESHVDRSINEPSRFIRTNIVCHHILLEVLRRLDKPLLHTSTDEVYGDLPEGVYADELYPLNPSNPYSASKAGFDLMLKAYGRTYGLEYVVVRPSNNYGPRQHPEKLVPRTIIRLLLGLRATVYGDGSQVRDWLYVEDNCRAIELVMRKGSKGEVYNICAGNHASVRDIVSRIALQLGREPSEWVSYVRGRPGEDRRYAMKCEKIRELGWRPLVSLEEGLARTVEWYRSNEWWWRPLLDEYILRDEPWVTAR